MAFHLTFMLFTSTSVTKTSSCPFAPKLTRNSLLGKRPIGKKKTWCQLEADAKLVKAVILEVVNKKDGGGVYANHANRGSSAGNNSAGSDRFESNGAGGMGEVLQNISNVIADYGNTLLENMKAEQDMRLTQSLDTPDRKAFAIEQMALRTAETREKRRRLDANLNVAAEQGRDKVTNLQSFYSLTSSV
ncbi:hypothetical protein MHU86_6926 [Fragilaria crotonensis]|nr:hypothetical protein MHU86_6926 [Fragilaria crotonensis]